MSNQQSPFDWKSRPSELSKLQEFNGVNHGRSVKVSKLEKNPIYLTGDNVYLETPKNQFTTHHKAKCPGK